MKQNWEVKKLSQIFDIKSSKRVHQSDWKSNGIPFYRAREVVKLAKDGYVLNELFISEELYEEFIKDKGAPKAGDIIVSAVGTLGQCYLVKDSDKFYFKDASVLWFENISNVDSRYIEYSFQSDYIMSQVMEGSMGATVGTLTISRAKDIEIPLPPLQEQQRIVDILDEAFSAIDKAKANTEQNLKNAKELFESELQRVFSEKGDGWEEKKLNEITEVKDGTHDSPKYIPEGIPFVTQKNIKPDGMTFEGTKYITDLDHEKFYKRSNVSKNDILISMIGANRGMAAIVDDERVFSIKNVGLIKSSANINTHFLLYYLKSSFAMKYILYMSNGGAQEFIGLTALRSFPIPYPPIKDQQTIVSKLDALREQTKKLEAVYEKKLQDLEELKKSVLSKALSGKL